MKCLVTKCTRQQAPALKRGLCMQCYSTAKKLVEQGATTWDKLVAMGLALDDPTANPFMEQFAQQKNTNERPG